MFNRNDLVEIIKPWAKNHASILAAWEGGSAATQRLDHFSDLDLSLIVLDDQVETVFEDLEVFLRTHFTILNSYRVPEPAWHGLSQCFYQIDQVEPFIYLDIAVIKLSQPDKLMESDRHGMATIWFDNEKIYDPSPTPVDKTIERGKRLYTSVTQTDFLIITEVEKGIERGHFVDVFPTYLSFISRHLGVLLNLTYRPERADFGLRYARLDYDDSDISLIDESFKVSSVQDIKIQFDKIKSRYYVLKSALKSTYV